MSLLLDIQNCRDHFSPFQNCQLHRYTLSKEPADMVGLCGK